MEEVEKTRRELGGKKVFLDIEYTPEGKREPENVRLTIRLYTDVVPKTCHNFVSFVKGGVPRAGETYSYKGTKFHRVIRNFMVQGGDVTRGDGRGGFSVYGERFKDESFEAKHTTGCLSMANAGPGTNGSQFFITVAETPWLDGKHVVFGKVDPECLSSLIKISEVETGRNDVPKNPVRIVDCGLI